MHTDASGTIGSSHKLAPSASATAAAPTAGRYRMLALDLDGTLFDRSGEVSKENVRAVHDAREAGLLVTVCTGRGLVESMEAMKAISQVDPVVVAGGAIIACPTTSGTLHRFALDRAHVEHATRSFLDQGLPSLVLKDPVAAGYDYLVVVGEKNVPLDPVTEWWFSKMNVKVRRVSSLDDDQHPEHTVRVGACAMSGQLAELKRELHTHLGDHTEMHHFGAVVAPEHVKTMEDGQKLHILEIFSKNANKFSAVTLLAARSEIRPHEIVALGDEVNDVSLLKGVGLGIAMGNAIAEVKAAAKRHTLSNHEHGVAHAIKQVLTGEW